MNRRHPLSSVVAATALALVLTGCTGRPGRQAAAPTTRQAPSTAVSTTPVPATTLPVVSPLTGLPQPEATKLNRPALVVKVDNEQGAQPQAGLNQADVVFEEQVEGGDTRLACVFQSADASPVGPVRSTRSTDIAIVSELNHPLYAFSGGNQIFLSAIRAAPIVDVGADAQPGAYHRVASHPAPHNLFSTTATLFALARTAGAPPALFSFRAAAEAVNGSGGSPARHAAIQFGDGGTRVSWDWDPSGQVWKRAQDGSVHLDASGAQVTATNVIVQFVDYRNTGLRDPAGSPVPEARLVGQGDAWIFTVGTLVKGHWSKSSPGEATTYADAGGATIRLTPGRSWVELSPVGAPAQNG
jgi:hypothetical protein